MLCERAAVDKDLLKFVNQRANSRARSHGNYLPALNQVLEILRPDAALQMHLLLVFLSDGAPSDHTTMECEHGVQVQ